MALVIEKSSFMKEAILIIPISLILIITLFCSSFYRMMIYGGYRKALEEELTQRNRLGGINTWEKYAEKKITYFNFGAVILYIVVSSIATLIFIYSINKIDSEFELMKCILSCIGAILLVYYFLLISFLGRLRYNFTYEVFIKSFRNSKEEQIGYGKWIKKSIKNSKIFLFIKGFVIM